MKPRVWTIRKEHLLLALSLLFVLTASVAYWKSGRAAPVLQPNAAKHRTIDLVAGEFSGKTADGREIEAYRWDPGTIVVNKGETVDLQIYGVNGDSHRFIIEGSNVKGEVRKGEVTSVRFRADKEGTYRILCLDHPDVAHNGPMIGYIVVD